jgi:hypothetical protein
MRIVNSLPLRVLLIFIFGALGGKNIFGQNQCATRIDLSLLEGGILQEQTLELFYPQTLSLDLSQLPVQWDEGVSYDLMMWLVEGDFQQSALSISFNGNQSSQIVWDSQTPGRGIYRLSFVYAHSQNLLNFFWELNPQIQAQGKIKIAYLGIQKTDCPLRMGLGDSLPGPSLWLMGEGPVWGQQRNQLPEHHQKVAHWFSLDEDGRTASQPLEPFQPLLIKQTGTGILDYPVIKFDGSNDVLGIDYFGQTPQGDFTLLIVFRTEDEFGTILTEVDRPDYYAAQSQCQVGMRYGKFSHRFTSGWDTYAQSYITVNNEQPRIGMVNVPPVGSRTVQVDGRVTGAHIVNEHQDSLPFLLLGGHQSYNAFRGDVAEILLFEPALKDKQLNQVQTYLSLKYGVPLEVEKYLDPRGDTILLDRNYRHQAGQLGINLEQFLFQNWSESEFGSYKLKVEVLDPADHQYLFWGDNGGSLQLTESFAPGEQNRLGRVWQFVEPVHSVGTVRLVFHGLPANLKSLLVHAEDDHFPYDGKLYCLPLEARSDGTYVIETDLPDKAFFTFSASLSPLFDWKLKDFTANQDGRHIRLNWETLHERYLESMVVERSVDGFLYQPVSRLPAFGDSEELQSYVYLDTHGAFLSSDWLYYRVKILAPDGFFAYSPVTQVKIGYVSTLSLIANYDPQLRAMNLRINSGSKANLHYRLLDTHGKVRYENKLGPGPHARLEKIPTPSLSPGLYFWELYDDGNHTFAKVLVTD